MNKKTEKIYCYVDETGQDTNGKLFIAVSIITDAEKPSLEIFLEACEAKSGRHKRKWQKTRKKEKERYIQLALVSALLKEKIYYRQFSDGKDYIRMTAESISSSIKHYSRKLKLGKFTTNIIIDGLNSKNKIVIAKIIRKNGIPIDKIRGMRDQSSSLIRLADTVAGLLRDAEEGDKNLQLLVSDLEKKEVINEV